MIKKILFHFNKNNIREIFSFGLVGITVTTAYYFFLLFLIDIAKIQYFVANVIATSIMSIFAFFGHKYLTFRSKTKPSLQEVVLFIIQLSISFPISSVILHIGHLMKFETWISALVVVFVIPIINFFVMKFLIFKDSR